MEISAPNDNLEQKGTSDFDKFIKSKLPISSTGKFILPKLSFNSNILTIDNKINNTENQTTSRQDIKNVQLLNELYISNTSNTGITKKLMNDNINNIDLTAALNSVDLNSDDKKLNSSNFNTISPAEVFDIPFLDGDLEMINKDNLLMQAPFNKIDKEKFKIRYKQKCNSKIGKILNLNYYCTKHIYVDHSFQPKLDIKSFDFSTKSPDDKIIESLNRQRIS